MANVVIPIDAADTTFNMAAHCIGRAAGTTPDKTALLVYASTDTGQPAETWSYADLEDAVLRIAAALLVLGLKRGDRLLIRLDNTSDYALLYFGAVAAGLVALPASTQLTAGEAAVLLADSGARALAVSPNLPYSDLPADLIVLTAGDVRAMLHYPVRAPYAETAADDPAFLIYTSGTTAKPKGVLHAHRSVLGRRPMVEGWYGLMASDCVLHAGAFNWTYTLGTGLADPWANGATAVVYTGDKGPALWPRLIRQSGATIFAAVPGVFRQILKYGALGAGSLGQLRHALMAGETPPPDLVQTWFAATGTELYEALGMSELSTFISSSPSVPRRAGTVGRPQPGRRVAILPAEDGTEPLPPGQAGLLAVHRSDPGLMLGYWNRPDEEAAVYRGDWFIGGDFAQMDVDGYVTHLGRANDVMKALGYRVAPQEVEAVLAQHPDVAEVACAEVRVRTDVSVIGAFIVPRDGAPRNANSILAFAAERLAAYKQPREIHFVDSLPRTANGKVMRRALGEAWQTVSPAATSPV